MVNDNSSGWLYIFSNPYLDGLLKIGYTYRDLDTRLNELSSTGVPGKFECVFAVLVGNDRNLNSVTDLETAIHETLSSSRAENDREFFDCTIDEAINAVGKGINKLGLPVFETVTGHIKIGITYNNKFGFKGREIGKNERNILQEKFSLLSDEQVKIVEDLFCADSPNIVGNVVQVLLTEHRHVLERLKWEIASEFKPLDFFEVIFKKYDLGRPVDYSLKFLKIFKAAQSGDYDELDDNDEPDEYDEPDDYDELDDNDDCDKKDEELGPHSLYAVSIWPTIKGARIGFTFLSRSSLVARFQKLYPGGKVDIWFFEDCPEHEQKEKILKSFTQKFSPISNGFINIEPIASSASLCKSIINEFDEYDAAESNRKATEELWKGI